MRETRQSQRNVHESSYRKSMVAKQDNTQTYTYGGMNDMHRGAVMSLEVIS